MSFNYNEVEVFSHIHIAKDENAKLYTVPKWGYICDSCGRDSRTSYGGKEAILSYNLTDIVEAWYVHLHNHGFTYPKPKPRRCDVTVSVNYPLTPNSPPGTKTINPVYRCLEDENHSGKHKFEF